MTFNFLLGIALIGFGSLTLLARLYGWHQLFWKRQAMKEKFGDRAGDVIHFMSYTFLPIVAGLVFVSS
jgi:hypothetical protein